MHVRHVLALASALSVLALAACSSSHPGAPAASAGQAVGASSTHKPAASHPAAAGHLHAELALIGQPAVTNGGKDIVVTVNVTNDGPLPFGTQATDVHNVNLGAHAVDAAGHWIVTNLARGTMPEVQPGQTVKATILLPVAKVLGYSAEILPVEESVAWFNKWGTKSLLVGPFKACSSPSVGKVCSASGKPFPTTTQP